MKTQKRVLPAMLVSLFAAMSPPAAEAAQFSGVYVFGDSLSDAGYYRPFLASLGLPAAVVSQLGSFTTNPDPVWAEIVSTYYGITPNPSNASAGNIFAQGGARVSLDSASTPPGGAQRPVSVQINEFLARGGGAADPNALYAVWAGGNDFLQNFQAFSAGQITQAQLQANFLAAAASEIQQVGRLRAAGARYVAVFALPDIGSTPFALGAGAAAAGAATQLSAGYNTTLFTGLASASIPVIPVDVFSLFGEIRANPAAYGFSNITGIACGPFPPITTTGNSQFCLPTNLVAPNANNTYLFADSIHPTGATHRIVAQFLQSLIEGPSNYSMLAESAMRSRESHVRSISDGLGLGWSDGVGKFNVFAGGDRTDFDIASGAGFPGNDTQTSAGTVGFSMRASENILVGAAYGGTKHEATLGGNTGEYRVDEKTWSLFGSLKWGGFYATGIASLAEVEFTNIKRNIVLGPVTRVAEGNTDGSNASFYFSTGYDFQVGNFAIGPTVAVTLQDIDVNGFDETGGGSAGLRVLAQTRKSEVWSAGARASYKAGRWTPWARVTADKERRDEAREVSAIPFTLLAVNSVYSVPTYTPDTTWVTASIGVNVNITPSLAVGVGYHYVDSRNSVKQDSLAGMVSVRF